MLHVHGVVIRLGKTAGDRLRDGKKPIQKRPTEEGIVNEIMGDSVDVGVNHQRVKKAEDQHDPKRRARIKEEERAGKTQSGTIRRRRE